VYQFTLFSSQRNDTQQSGVSGGEALGISCGSSRQEHHRFALLLHVHSPLQQMVINNYKPQFIAGWFTWILL
jgi:hypothetical protein